jgi:hypothetical protein
LGKTKSASGLDFFINFSISSDLRGASTDKFTGPLSVIKTVSSILTAIPHHLGSQSLLS